MRGLLIYSIFGSSLKRETVFSLRAKNCSTLAMLLTVISEAFPCFSARSWRNSWLTSSMVQSRSVTGVFFQQISHTAEKRGAMKCLSVMLSGVTMGSAVALLAQILICSLLFQFFCSKQVRLNRVNDRWTLGLFVFFLQYT